MTVKIIPIGNSKGIRIPKAILKQCHINNEVDLEIDDDNIIIKPKKNSSRKNWEKAFKLMRKKEDDKLIIDDSIDLDMEDWKW